MVELYWVSTMFNRPPCRLMAGVFNVTSAKLPQHGSDTSHQCAPSKSQIFNDI